MKMLILITSMFFLTACANPYSKFYQGTRDARTLTAYVPTETEVLIYSTNDFDKDTDNLARKGYLPIGQSSFQAGSNSVSESQIREQATKIGAHVVLIASRYSHSVSGAIPLTLPNTTTSYTSGSATAYGNGGMISAYGRSTTTTYGTQTKLIPYSVDRSEFGARYFAKAQSRLGIIFEPINNEIRKRIQSNAGVSVRLVVEGSSAFDADVLPGDIIITVGNDKVQTTDHFQKLLDMYEGQKPVFKIVRDNQLIEKQIEVRRYKSLARQGASDEY